ncbi:odorant receptor 10-like [Halyomorpha halys]|uniref:odorant receptor 10-like n=1 Tax=Halyomorpha halys TaxID=286706 RepID=UPI0034D36EBD
MRGQFIADSDLVDGLSVRYLKLFGLWKVINDYRTSGKKNKIIKFELAITSLLVVPYICFQYLSYFHIDVDIQKATFLNLHSITGVQMFCKMLVFWFRIDSQSKLYNLVRKDFLDIPLHKRTVAKEIYKNITKKSNVFCNAAFLVNASIVTIAIVCPGLPVDYILYHTGNMDAVTTGRKKVLGGWYPFPMAQSPYFEAIFVYEAVILVIGGIFLGSYVCLFFQVLMCLYAQFAVLGYHLSTLKISPERGDTRVTENRRDDSKMYKELYGIVKEHRKLLSYANELRSVYNPLVTMILGMGLLVLIISVFQFLFGSTGNPMFIFRSLQFVAYQGIEACMFCFGSSFVETASSDLQFAIYSSDWYKANVKFRKAAQMMMMRSRKGVTLTAIRMYPVNVETLMAMLQFTYSVAALLSRMME